jgi:hypothetical protein
MEEYRYFEAIKRRREENLTIISMLYQNNDEIDILQLIKEMSLYSDVKTIKKDETTEILELKKNVKDETEIFEKIIEAITKIRTK